MDDTTPKPPVWFIVVMFSIVSSSLGFVFGMSAQKALIDCGALYTKGYDQGTNLIYNLSITRIRSLEKEIEELKKEKSIEPNE